MYQLLGRKSLDKINFGEFLAIRKIFSPKFCIVWNAYSHNNIKTLSMCVVGQLLSDAKAASIVKNLMTASGRYPWHQTVVQMKTQICVYVASLSVHKVW